MEKEINIIGRREEMEVLSSCYKSGKPEMVVVYGRRRVGKTHLIKKMYGDEFAFYMTGIYRAPKKRQLANFAYSLSEYSGRDEAVPDNWMEAFRRLKEYLKGITTVGRKVVFIDELPWLDTKKSDLLEALDLFWNGWGNNNDELMLILCGSATSWMTDKLLGDKGGMFNRDTARLYLSPFTLRETELFLQSKGINASRYEIAEYYMVMGGIPYYLDKIQRGKSVAQNIDQMFFKRRGLLWDEFEHLYSTLFSGNELYVRVVKLLGTRREGFTRDEIVRALEIHSGGDLTKCLGDLCNCDFLLRTQQFGKGVNGTVYRLADFYTLFYLHFLQNVTDEHYWSNNIDSPERRNWSGHAFEMECMWHLQQIKNALGIGGITSESSTYRIDSGQQRTQIDLIISRRDDVLNLCEIKFCRTPFGIDADYAKVLQQKRDILASSIAQRQSIHLTMLTTFGLKEGKHTGIVDRSLTLDDLFL